MKALTWLAMGPLRERVAAGISSNADTVALLNELDRVSESFSILAASYDDEANGEFLGSQVSDDLRRVLWGSA